MKHLLGLEELSAAEITRGSEGLASGASEQASSLEEVSSSLQELASMTRQNAASAQEAKTLADGADAAVRSGAASMTKLTEAIGQIKSTSDATALPSFARGGDDRAALVCVHELRRLEQPLLLTRGDGQEAMLVGVDELPGPHGAAEHLHGAVPADGDHVRVADAQGAPPTIPFWLGEAPARTRELSAEIAKLRERSTDRDALIADGVEPVVAGQLAEYVAEGVSALGVVPTERRIVIERFFDESGGMQLVIHAPFGGRVNRAWGLALRKRFCVTFDFELQAAATDNGIVISLGEKHSFPLESVFGYLHSNSVREVLIQAVLLAPMFATRWRWNASR